MLPQNLRLIFVIALGTILFTGCSVGPNFMPPSAPEFETYTANSLPEQTVSAPVFGGKAQVFAYGQEVPFNWWYLFNSEKLNHVVLQALSASLTIAAAEATLLQAIENFHAKRGVLQFPQVDLNGSAADYFISNRSFKGTQPQVLIPKINLLRLYNASVDVTYNFDIFGSTRRVIEASKATVDAEAYRLQAVHLTLAANIITTVFNEALLRKQREIYLATVALEEAQLSITSKQFQIGGIAKLDVIAQQGELARTKGNLPSIEKKLVQTRNQLAVYAGLLPQEECRLPKFYLEDFTLPTELPLSFPSELVRNRPDILVAEARLHETTANVGVAISNFYPQLALSASYGPLVIDGDPIFNFHAWIASLGAALTQPIFHGGELIAKRQAAIAAFDKAAADYYQTVLQAFQNVADVLAALQFDAEELKVYTEAAERNQETLNITTQQYDLGGVSYLAILDARRQYERSLLKLVESQVARLADTAALFQALGGKILKESKDESCFFRNPAICGEAS